VTPIDKINTNSPKAVIAGAFQTGVLGVRNLKRHGVKAICFDSNQKMQGFRSVYGPARLCPDPDCFVEDWLRFMQELSAELGEKAILIPSSDKYVTAIADHHETLNNYFTLSPGIVLQGLLAQKQAQYQLAMDHDMPMPKTAMVGTVEKLSEFADNAQYPCLLKPSHFREWEHLPIGHALLNCKVSIGSSKDELIRNYLSVRGVSPNVIVQEIIKGPDANKRVYLSCYNRDGERIANAMFRELRCVPLGFGPASVSEPVEDEEADDICNTFLQNIGYSGICEIEVKRDSRDGKVKLIEANPRLSGGGDAAPYAGVDLVWIHYQEMIGKTVEYVSPNGKSFKHIVLRGEGTAVPEYMRAGLLSWKDLFKSYKPPLAFFDIDLHDWKISLESILVFLRTLISNIFRTRRKD
jgi:predicted ATP-grasp superfamily ATP-dependent carboligase